MNTHAQRSQRLSAVLPIILLSVLLSPTRARAVDINVTYDPPGPVTVGSTVTVRVSVSNWNAADGEVDSVSVFVDFDPALFSYVPGSGFLETGANQFLAEPNQDLANYTVTDDSTDAGVAFGRYGLSLFDSDLGGGLAGSIGGADNAGGVGGFVLQAIAVGSGTVTPGTNNVNEVFLDPDLFGISPTGGISFNGAAITVEPDLLTYPKWRAAIPFVVIADGDPEADPDFDGCPNLMEYALDKNPLVPDADNNSVELTVVDSGGIEYLGISYVRPTGSELRTDLTYGSERTTALEIWSSAGVVESITAGPAPNTETVVIRSTTPLTALVREFLRFTVTL